MFVNSSALGFQTIQSDDDIIFKGNDNGSTITALTLDMSDAGSAFFNADITLDRFLKLRTTDDQANQWLLYTGTSDKLEFNYNGAGNAEVVIDNAGQVGIGTTNPQRKLVLYQVDSGQTQIQFQNVTTGSAAGDGFGVGLDSAEKGFIWNYEGNDTYIGGAGGTSITIKNDGKVMIGTSSPGRAGEGADMLTIGATSNNSGMTMRSGTSGYGSIYFSDGTSGTDEYKGYLQYGHANDVLHMAAGASIIMNLKDGKVAIGGNFTPDNPLDIVESSSGYAQIRIGTNKTDNTNKTAGIISTTYTNQSVSMFQMFNQNGSNALYYGSADGAHRGIQTHYFYVNTNYNSTSGHSLALTINSSGLVSGDLNDTSDIGFKENIQDLESALDKVKLLKPRTFTWKGNKQAAGNSVGFVAQEVETVITDDTIVKGNDYNEETKELTGKSLNTIGLVSYLTKAVQELSAKLEAAEARITTLEG